VRIAAALLASALVLVGCTDAGSADGPGVGTNSQPATSASSAVTVKVVIKDGKVTPQGKRVEVKVGEPVSLSITSDADEEIHVHSDPEHEYEVGPGEAVTESLTIDTPGQVAVEAHHLDVTIAQLVVRP
jgi:uncharacterized cupredoxin-like copper-binding protein